MSNQFEGFRLDIPSDQNSFVTVRKIDIVVDGAGLIPGSVSALYDFDVNKKGFWVQNLVKVDDGPQFRPIQDHSTALRFDSPVPIDLNDQRVKAPWFLSPLSVSIFLACMAIGFASLIVGVTLLAIRLRFSAMPAISNYLAVVIFVGGVVVFIAGTGPFNKLSSEDWRQVRDVVRAYFELPHADTFARRFEEERRVDLLTPQEASVDVRSRMVAKSPSDLAALREKIIRHMWPSGLPLDRRAADLRETKLISSVRRAYEFTVKLDLGLSSRTTFLEAAKGDDCLMVFNDGHYVRGGRFNNGPGWRIVERLLKAGCDMLFVSMPLYFDRQPVFARKSSGERIRLREHNAFFEIDNSDRWALRFFLEPTIVSLNEVLDRKDYRKVGMVGLSGGGWSTILLAALDTRITHSYPSLVVLPPPTQPVTKHFNPHFEYIYPPLFKVVDHYSLMLMGVVSPARDAIHSYTRSDIVFAGNKTAAFAPQVSAIAQELNGGNIRVFVDQTSGDHAITPKIADVILGHFLSQ